MEKLLQSLVKQVKSKINLKPELAIILGSGLGNFADLIENKVEIPYSSLKGMPTSTVKGHSGQFIFGQIKGINILAMQGRLHLYEGYSAKEVTLPIYLFKKLGVESLIVTNAAGAVNDKFEAGDLMVITDQINLTGKNPLISGSIVDYGIKFIDMTKAYNKNYIKLIDNIALKNKIEIKKGTYIQFLGPTYETPAEVKMARAMGADAVGMSTAVEVIAATQAGLKTLAVSAIANMAVGITEEDVTHDMVLETMEKASKNLVPLMIEFIKNLHTIKK
jgi:purine-nucleoside phosphorylase